MIISRVCVSDNRDVFRQVCLCWVKLGVTDVCDEFLLQSDVWYVHIKTKAVFRRRARVKEAQLESAHRIFSSTHLTKMETGSPLPSQAVQICRAVGRCYCICKSFEQSSGKFHVIFFFFFIRRFWSREARAGRTTGLWLCPYLHFISIWPTLLSKVTSR